MRLEANKAITLRLVDDTEPFHQAPPRPIRAACAQVNSSRSRYPRADSRFDRARSAPGCSRVRKSSVLPAQNDSDVGREVLLGAIDVSNVHDPYRVGDLRWTVS
jgi:hypothetical protein